MAKPWFFQMMGAEIGPLTSAELMAKVQIGQIEPDTLVRSGKDGKWIPAFRWKGLLPSATEPPPAHEAAEPKSSEPSSIETPAKADSIPINEEDDPLYHLKGEAAAGAPIPFTHPDEYDFFQFVGFRQAISHKLYDALVAYSHQHQLTVTQITRRSIAHFIGKPELGDDKPPQAPDAIKADDGINESEDEPASKSEAD